MTRIDGIVETARFSRFSAVLKDGSLERLEIRIDAKVFSLTAIGMRDGLIVFQLVGVDTTLLPSEQEPVNPSLPSRRGTDPPGVSDEMDGQGARDEGGPPSPNQGDEQRPEPSPAEVVKIAVFYTFAARVEAAGLPWFVDIEDEIVEAVADANITFEGQIGLTLDLVLMQEVSYFETGSIATDLDRLTCPCDHKIDGVGSNHLNGVFAPWNSYDADIVSLWVSDYDEAGIANIMSHRTSMFSPRAANVVDWVSAAFGFTMEHEIGHNFGARHDRFKDDFDGYPDDFNHGHINFQSPTFGMATLMGYPSVCQILGAYCFRVPLWSDPNYPPANDWGVAPPSDIAAYNKRTLELSLPYVSDFDAMHDTWLGCCVNVGTFWAQEWRPGQCP